MEEKKERIDVELVRRGVFKTRQKAKFAIEEGIIFVNQRKIEKVSSLVLPTDKIEIKGNVIPYVSRGGLKLEKAIKTFRINLNNKICMDIGASTGGFTDCMLQNGAKKVYAIDVGHDQLEESLRKNEKVVNMEGTNVKELKEKSIEKVDFIGSDISFISITQALPEIYNQLKIKGEAVILIKPQFEAGKANLTKTGVVKDIKMHKKILHNIILFTDKMGFLIKGLTYSPVKGPAGNIEYLLYIQKNENNLLDMFFMKEQIEKITTEAFKILK